MSRPSPSSTVVPKSGRTPRRFKTFAGNLLKVAPVSTSALRSVPSGSPIATVNVPIERRIARHYTTPTGLRRPPDELFAAVAGLGDTWQTRYILDDSFER